MKKIIKIFTFILIGTIPLGVLLRLNISPGVSVVPQDIVVGLIFSLTTVYFVFVKKTMPQQRQIYYALVAFIGMGLVSLFINIQTFKAFSLTASLLYVVRFLAYSSLLFVGEIVPESYTQMRRWFMWVGFVVLIIGFLQFLFYNNLRNLFYLGWDDHLYRLFSVFLDPNFAGAFYVIFIFIVLSLLFKKNKRTDSKQVLMFSSLIILSSVSVYLTYSRTAFIMLLSGAITFLVLKHKIKELILVVLLLIIGLFIFSDIKVEGLNPFRTASSKNRLISAEDALSIFSKHPITGVGFNSYRYAQIHYGTRDVEGGTVSNADAGTDNSYLFVLATTGTIGAVIFVIYYVLILKKFMKIKDKHVRAVWLSMLCSFLIGGLFVNLLFYTPILLVINLFTGFAIQRNTKE